LAGVEGLGGNQRKEIAICEWVGKYHQRPVAQSRHARIVTSTFETPHQKTGTVGARAPRHNKKGDSEFGALTKIVSFVIKLNSTGRSKGGEQRGTPSQLGWKSQREKKNT